MPIGGISLVAVIALLSTACPIAAQSRERPTRVERVGPTKAVVLTDYAADKYAEGSSEAKLHAAEAWRTAAGEYVDFGLLVEATTSLVNAARAYRETGNPRRAIEVLNEAGMVATASGARGVGWSPAPGPSPDPQYQQRREANFSRILTELKAAEMLMPPLPPVEATVKSTPAGQEVKYRRFVEVASPLTSITTDEVRALPPATYLFVGPGPGGQRVEKIIDCWVNCRVEFP